MGQPGLSACSPPSASRPGPQQPARLGGARRGQRPGDASAFWGRPARRLARCSWLEPGPPAARQPGTAAPAPQGYFWLARPHRCNLKPAAATGAAAPPPQGHGGAELEERQLRLDGGRAPAAPTPAPGPGHSRAPGVRAVSAAPQHGRGPAVSARVPSRGLRAPAPGTGAQADPRGAEGKASPGQNQTPGREGPRGLEPRGAAGPASLSRLPHAGPRPRSAGRLGGPRGPPALRLQHGGVRRSGSAATALRGEAAAGQG